MRALVETLCSDRCAGRAPGTPEGLEARRAVTSALREVGLDPFEQLVPGCRGANVLANIPGEIDRYILLGAHFDHLGKHGKDIYWGADDNAAAVAILVEVAGALISVSPEAEMGRTMAESLLAACDRNGRLPERRRDEVRMLVGLLEARLA